MALHRIYLVPGFFGFANLGDMAYWGPVQRALTAELARMGVEARIHVVPTPPTASLRVRASALLDAILTTAADDDALHLVGHSSGGLDARLLVTPGAVLRDEESAEQVAARVRTVLTVATPHRGTPSAELFASLYGKRLLRLLSLATVFIVRRGNPPLQVVLRLLDAWRRAVDWMPGRKESTIDDQLFDALLSEFSPERRDAVRAFFGEIGADQGLLSQITPDGMDLFDAMAPDRPGVRYGCIVTRGRRPSAQGVLERGLSPQRQAMAGVYASCWLLASRATERHLGPLTESDADALTRAYGEVPEASDNDGMVPTRSQVRGTLVRAVTADHLDVLGHYPDPETEPPRYDWVTSGSDFRRTHFDATWIDAAHFLMGV